MGKKKSTATPKEIESTGIYRRTSQPMPTLDDFRERARERNKSIETLLDEFEGDANRALAFIEANPGGRNAGQKENGRRFANDLIAHVASVRHCKARGEIDAALYEAAQAGIAWECMTVAILNERAALAGGKSLNGATAGGASTRKTPEQRAEIAARCWVAFEAVKRKPGHSQWRVKAVCEELEKKQAVWKTRDRKKGKPVTFYGARAIAGYLKEFPRD